MANIAAELERFRSIIQEEWDRNRSEGRDVHSETRLSAIAIACRHFARGGDLPAAEILCIASEVTGVPMETMKDANGVEVQVWRPVRGEVGYLPYDVPPSNWTGEDWEWDEFAGKWFQPGAAGRAINHVPVGA